MTIRKRAGRCFPIGGGAVSRATAARCPGELNSRCVALTAHICLIFKLGSGVKFHVFYVYGPVLNPFMDSSMATMFWAE
nr:hypothetical protein Itr_chr12CG19170 [Ipomoea trifida]